MLFSSGYITEFPFMFTNSHLSNENIFSFQATVTVMPKFIIFYSRELEINYKESSVNPSSL
jgi:hypothetical protein